MVADLQKKKVTLKKLYITTKLPKDRRIDVNTVYTTIKAVYNREPPASQKDLVEPEHFMCGIGGFIMNDPVTLESGRTYERSQIEMYWEY